MLTKRLVTLLPVALSFAGCNASKSDVLATSEDSNSSSSLKLVAVNSTFAVYNGGFCTVKPGDTLTVSQVDSANVEVDASFLKVKAISGKVRKVGGYYSNRDEQQSKPVAVSCDEMAANHEFVLGCGDWSVSGAAGAQLDDKLCEFDYKKFFNKTSATGVVAGAGQPVGGASNAPEAISGPTIEVLANTILKPPGADGQPHDSSVSDYCTVKAGVYQLKEEKVLQAKHYKIILANKLSDDVIVGGFLYKANANPPQARVPDPAKTACKGLTYYVYQDSLKGQ